MMAGTLVQKLRSIIIMVLGLAAVLVHIGDSHAHSPHDVIFDIALSPDYQQDKTAFVITSNTLMISSDEGFSWKKLANGIDYKSQLMEIAISPGFSKDGTILVISEKDGIYRSDNRGKSWKKNTPKSVVANIRSVTFSADYLNDTTAFAIDDAGNLHRSVDSARSWAPIHHEFDSAVTCARSLSAGNDERIIVGTKGGDAYVFSETSDIWEKITNPFQCGGITTLTVSPGAETDEKIWLGSEQCGVLEIDLQDMSMREFNQGMEKSRITSLLAKKSPNDDIMLYASSWNDAIFLKNAGGDAWIKYDNGLSKNDQADDPYFSLPHFRGIASDGEVMLLGGFNGLFKSLDSGKTWQHIDTIMLSGITGMDIFSENGSGKHQLALATYGAGAYLYQSESEQWQIINHGLEWTRLNDIQFSDDHSKDGLIFSGSEKNFLTYSSNSGVWKRVPVNVGFKRKLGKRLDRYMKKMGISAKWRKSVYKPKSSDALFPTATVSSPSISEDKSVYFGTRSSGLYKSDDKGLSNSKLWNANAHLITSLSLSPQFASDRTTFIGLYGDGVYKSTDKGKSWSKTGAGANANMKGKVVLGISPDFGNDNIVVAGTGSGIFMTMDRGANWKPIGEDALDKETNINAIAISPAFSRDKTILVSAIGGGLWMSKDMGKSFTKIAKELIENNYQAKFIKFSNNYEQDGIIYCASSYALFRSKDRGQSWEMMQRPIRYENLREEIKYTGDWRIIKDERFSALSASTTNSPNSKLTLRFKGTGFVIIGDRTQSGGKANLRMDGEILGTMDLKNGPAESRVEIFSKKGLSYKSRELSIEIMCSPGQPNCGDIIIDAIDIVPDKSNEIENIQ